MNSDPSGEFVEIWNAEHWPEICAVNLAEETIEGAIRACHRYQATRCSNGFTTRTPRAAHAALAALVLETTSRSKKEKKNM
jgi:hypothetical protein